LIHPLLERLYIAFISSNRVFQLPSTMASRPGSPPSTDPHPDSEQTPLLNGSSRDENARYDGVNLNGEAPATRPDDYLNKPQILFLSYTRMIDPVAFFCIVPFINQMIYDLGDFPESDVGFYSGVIVSFSQ
jgi:hypothetical protein